MCKLPSAELSLPRMAVSYIKLYQKGNFTYDTTTASLRNPGRGFQIDE